MKSLVGFLVLIFSVSAVGQDGKEGGAGDEVRPLFRNRGHRVVDFFERTDFGQSLVTKYQLDTAELRATLNPDRIRVQNEPIKDRGGSDVDAYTSGGVIDLVKANWIDIFSNGRPIDYLVCHEMMRSAKVAAEGDDYGICGYLVGINTTRTLVSETASGHQCEFSKPAVRLTQQMYQDPYYERYLVPGNIDYSQMFSNLDRSIGIRQKIFDEFMASISGIQFDNLGVASFDFYSVSPTRLAAYARAVEQSLTPVTGLRVAETNIERFRYKATIEGPFGLENVVISSRDFVLDVYVTVDVDAEKKIELFKIESLAGVEQAASRLRREIYEIHTQDLELLQKRELLTPALGDDPSEEEIRSFLELVMKSGTYEVASGSIQIEKYESEDLNSDLSIENLGYVTSVVNKINQCLANGKSIDPGVVSAWTAAAKHLVEDR